MPGFWEVTASNAVVVCLLAVVAWLLGHVWKNPAALHLVWLAVLAKLLIPPVYVAAIRFPGWTAAAPDAAAIAEQPRLTAAVRGGALAAQEPATAATAQAGSTETAGLISPPRGTAWHWPRVLMILWLSGAAITGLWFAWRIVRFRRLLRDAQPAPEEVAALARQICARLHLRRVPEICLTRHPLPPLVWSLGGAPRIILPGELFARLGDAARETILAHELIHIARRDHWVRLFELVVSTLFWWHPVVALARWQLRRLEEECCDGRVLAIVPQPARVYATALVDTLDFIAEQPRAWLPLPTAIGDAGTLARRICTLNERRTHRLGFPAALAVAAVTALPLAIALAADEAAKPAATSPPATSTPAAPTPATTTAATIEGRVTSKAGEPLADVVVKAAIPAKDMRYVAYHGGFKTLQTRTDQHGQYKLDLPAVAKTTKVSLNAMKPGFRSLSGAIMNSPEGQPVEVSPGKVAEASFQLEPAIYVKGLVVDEEGMPVADAEIFARAEFPRASGGIEITTSRADGSFEVFNYPLEPTSGGEAFRGEISFQHPDYIQQKVADIYPLSSEERAALRVVLPKGRKIAGRVFDANGRAVPGVMIEAARGDDDGDDRKAVISDSEGRFVLQGLVAGPTFVRAHAIKLRQKIKTTIALDSDNDDLELRMEPIVLKSEPAAVKVLGMTLTDVTPEIRAAYDLYYQQGALILDPGRNSARLDIGDLVEGDCFFMVGEQEISSVRDFVERILAETAGKEGDSFTCRVVYGFRKTEFIGTNTQYLKLTADDLAGLRQVLAELPAK